MAPVSPVMHLPSTRQLSSVESYCVPDFDSPSVFARILDDNKVRLLRTHRLPHSPPPQGGHFSIAPTVPFTAKQNYVPNSNVRPAVSPMPMS